MPFCIISWSDSKLFRLSGGFFMPLSFIGRFTLNVAHNVMGQR
jgi:hypothetical protein